MNVFELDEALVNDYERFARSFTQIRAPDIRTHVEALYASDRILARAPRQHQSQVRAWGIN
jgi:hypothetical protein